MKPMNQEYRVLAAFVRRVQGGLYLRRLLQSGVWLLTILLTMLLLGLGVQQLIPHVPLVAPLYSALTALVLLFLGGYVLLPALRSVSQRQALTDIEQTYPELHDDLTNALQLDPEALQRTNPRGIALDLVQALHRHTVAQVQHYRVQTVVQRRRVLGVAWCGGLVLTAVVVTLLRPYLLGESLHILLTPLSYLPPREMHISITPEQATIARGTNLEVRAQTSGRLPRTMQLLVKRQGQEDKHYPMEPLEPGTFRYTFLKPQTSFAFSALAGGSTSPQGRVEVVPSPAIGKMTLYYLFPNYTGLPARTQEGGGDIQALPGTQVRLTMHANVPLSRGTLRFDDNSQLPLEIAEETILRGEILVMKEGTYVVEVEDTHGLKNLQPPRYTVQILPDLHPTVTIRQPQDGLEVDETTTLQVQYEAEDDFGLQDAALVYFGPGAAERRIALRQGRFDNRRVQETFLWDMQQWPLPAGDTVQFYVEVYDNDTISGPKKGTSQTLTLKIRNREQEHGELERLQADMANALLDLLAEHLQLADQLQEWRQQADTGTAPDQAALRQAQDMQQAAMEHAEQVSQQLQEALARVQRDPYSTFETYADLQALQRNMTHLQQSLLPQLQQSLQALAPQPAPATQLAPPERALEQVVQELERLSSLAEHIARGEKFNDLMNVSTKMMEQQNKLLAALDNLPKDFRGELPPELQKMLDALDTLMRELLNAASQLPTSLSDEFLNRQLDSLPLADMMRQLQEMRQKLAEGDLEGAKKLAEELLKALSTMVVALQNMRQQARGGAMDAMSQQLQQSSDQLADLVRRQERILDETQHIDQDTLRQLNEAQQHAFDAVQQRLQQELNKLSKLTWELSRQARQHPNLDAAFQQAYQQLLKHLQTLRQNVETRDMPQAATDLEAAQRQLAWMQRQVERLEQPDAVMQQQTAQALESLQAMRQQMHSLPQDRQAMLTPTQEGQLGELSGQQGGVRQDTQALHQAFESLLPLMPFLPTELGKNLQEAMPFMGQAQGELEERQSQQAIPPEQQALEHLRSAQNSLQQALQQMAQRGQMMGMSMPMLQQAGRLPLPNYMPQPGVEQSNSGMAGASVRNFQLPDKEAYKAPRMFREDIVEALKEGYPERYKELIEQYYRNIVR